MPMFSPFRALWKTLFHFRGYRPQRVTLLSLWRWLSQFPFSSGLGLLSTLDHVIYLSEDETQHTLASLNQGILSRLESDGYGIESVIYLSFDTAGSSSPVVLNLLRDAENLERRGAHLLSSQDIRGLKSVTGDIGAGAIVYVDDFCGTGSQFLRNRSQIAEHVTGAFSEFVLAPVICEEAYARVEDVGVVPIAGLKHTRGERPLHPACDLLPQDLKQRITDICYNMHPKLGLGFGELATMVVFYRNAPNTMPLVFRGNLGQSPLRGIFPRSDDLPYAPPTRLREKSIRLCQVEEGHQERCEP